MFVQVRFLSGTLKIITMEEKRIVCNRAKCLDCGDIIISKHRHDFVKCTCGNLAVDGGESYLRRLSTPKRNFEEMTVYSDAPFKELREVIYRGGRGKDGKQPLKWVKLSEISDDWLQNIIKYEEGYRPDNRYLPYYRQEQEYRQQNNISIEE